jgi:epoxyqueuosine reductase
MERSHLVLEFAAELGFDAAGIAPLRPPRGAERFRRWLEEGRHGSMTFLERQSASILDPRRIREGTGSILVVGVGHSRPALELEGGARVARYAAGRDYHNWIGRRLTKLGKRLAREGFTGPFRRIVDAGPLLERSHAAEAGLGFESKSANLLSPRFGPWFFLGELLIEEELTPTEPQRMPSCGSCTACLDACPTGAIVEPGVVHSPLCISYQTIEQRGAIPHELRERVGEWVFGCDVCSEVCPFGHRAPDLSERFGVHPMMEAEGKNPLLSWLAAGESFSELFNGSPLQRPRREGLARNAAIVLGNRPRDEGREALGHALRIDPSPLVREAAAWALLTGHGRDRGVREEVEAAWRSESDEDAARGMARSLSESR